MATYNPVPARRGSLVGPLILLALGVVFLVSNLRPEISLWRLFATYWPFLLILWGGAKLLEYTIARLTSRPIGRTVSGGEIFLVILLCLAGRGFYSAAGSTWWSAGRLGQRSLDVFGETFDFPVETRRPAAAASELVIQNLRGNVNIVGADSREIVVSGRKAIKGYDRGSAEETDRATPVEIKEEGGKIWIRTNQERFDRDRRVSTDLQISVPKNTALSLEGRYGDFDVKDVAGSVAVNSANAGVRLLNIGGNVRIQLRRSDIVRVAHLKGDLEISGRGGDIELENIAGAVAVNGEFSGSIKLQNVARPVRYKSSQTELSLEKLPGRMEMDRGMLLVNDVVGPFRLTVNSKDVRLEEFTKEVQITSRRGDIELRTGRLPLADIRAESRSGNIELALPPNARFNLQAQAKNGRAENDFGDAVKIEDRGRTAEMSSTAAGKGPGAQIQLSTERGNIVFRKLQERQSL